MAGNVWEFVADWYGPYLMENQRNPQGPLSGSSRVLRGGSWDGNYGNGCGSIKTFFREPDYFNGKDRPYWEGNTGFRCSITP